MKQARPAPLLVLLSLLALAACVSGDGDPGPSDPPEVSVLQPAADAEIAEDSTVAIRYADSDPDSIARTDVLADRDGNLGTTGDQVTIVDDALEQDGVQQDVTWDTSGAAPGEYRIFARTTDGKTTVVDEAPGRVRINAKPTVAIQSPSSAVLVAPGQSVEVVYVDDDPDDQASTTIWADGDGDLSTTSDQYAIATDVPELDGQTQSVTWDTTGATFGSYAIVARTRDVLNEVVESIGAGVVTLGQPSLAGAAGGPEDDEATEVVTWPDGSFAIVGIYEDLIEFEQVVKLAEGGSGLTVPEDEESAFLARYAADGTFLWARAFAWGGEADELSDVRAAALPDGSVVLAGSAEEELLFAPGTPDEVAVGSTASNTAFVARYTAAGDLAWVLEERGVGLGSEGSVTGDLRATDVAVLGDGTIAVAGWFQNGVVFDEDGPMQTFLVSANVLKMFLARYDANGDLLSVRPDGGTPTGNGPRVVPNGIEPAADGGLIVTGLMRGSLTMGEGDPNEVQLDVLPPEVYSSPFVARYDANVELEWVAVEGTNAGRCFYFGSAELPDGSVVTSGWFEDAVTIGQGTAAETSFDAGTSKHGLLARYDTGGELLWAREVVSLSGQVIGGRCTAVGPSLFWIGLFYEDAQFDAFPLSDGRGYESLFVAELDAGGAVLWARDSMAQNTSIEGVALATLADGALVAGSFDGPASFGDDDVLLVPEEGGEDDVFFALYRRKLD